MKYAIVENGVVVNLAVADEPLEANWIEFDGPVTLGDLWDGAAFSPAPIPQRSPDEVQAEVVAATQARLDAFARTRNYDGILSLCTYATSPTPKFAAEGQYGVEARDATWAKLYDMLAEVQAGTRPMPTGFADVEPELPALVWPN